ncbi:MAG TPA: lysophospholipid acyltransferase family protein [Ktedonobacterales bacterium]|jgi:KDO2-lipid IV(A) lauroyltransferase|nr:lysophospholipid acyltransferase family protein [Ktedonobacterales bacterium]
MSEPMRDTREGRGHSESLREQLDPKYWLFLGLANITPLAPLWLARRIAIAAGTLTWLAAGPLRRRAERNLRRIPSLAADPARLRSATQGVFINLALNYLDFFRGRHVTYEELSRGWRISGWDVFERAMRAGHGVIVMGAHLGPFEYAGWKMGELGCPLLTPAEHLRPERFNQLVGRLRNHHQARLLPGDDRETLRELLTSLRKGQMAMFAIDRWVMGPSDPWPLFGEPAPLPTAPFALAARSDAPVFLLVPWRAGPGRFGGAVELITPERLASEDAPGEAGVDTGSATPRGRDREAAIARMRERLYPLLERYISEHPEQWVSALSPVWESSEAQSSVARRTQTGGDGAAPTQVSEQTQREPATATRRGDQIATQ